MEERLKREGITERSQEAARQMTSGIHTDLKRDLVSTGAHEVVNELGYHSELLTDAEADFLTLLLIEEGLNGLERYGNGSHDEFQP